MAYSTMKDLFKAICDAIRSKDGTTGSINHQDIPARIQAISGDGSSGGIIINDANAESSDIAKDKVAYVNGGERVIGTLRVAEGDYPITSDITLEKNGNYINTSYVTASDYIARKGLNFKFQISGERFGDADISDVVAGKTFTSKNGVKLTGTHVCNDSGNIEPNNNDIEVESLSDLHYWTKTGASYSYEEVYQSNGVYLTYGSSNTIQYGDDVVALGDGLALVNPKDYTITDDDAAEGVLLGKYVRNYTGDFYRIPSDARIIYNSPSQYTSAGYRVTTVYKINIISGTEQSSTVVISTDSSAYPENGEQDGFTYVYQGTLGG